MLAISHLATGYRQRLKTHLVGTGLTATLPQGRLTALLGTNGVGKSTLLRTLAGLQPALGGTVNIDGQDLSDISVRELARRLSIVLTHRGVHETLTVKEVVELGRLPYEGAWWQTLRQDGAERESEQTIVDEALRRCDITHLAARPINQLSDGERQRVFIAKALAQQTPIILLDEPSAFLDYPSKLRLFQTLRDLAHEGQKAILVSTHEVDMAVDYADELWLLKPTAIEIAPHDATERVVAINHFFRLTARPDRTVSNPSTPHPTPTSQSLTT